MGHRLHRPQSAQAGSGAEPVRSTVHGPRSKAGACLRPSVATLGAKLAGRSLLSQRLRHKVDGLLEWRTLVPNQRATLSLYFVASRYPKTAHTFRRDALRAGPFGFALFEERA